MLQIERAAPILGGTFMERMTGKKHAVMTIGNEVYTRHRLVTEIGTGNFRAARILDQLCKDLKVNSLKDLYAFSYYELSGTHGFGETALFVLLGLFDHKGLDWRKWTGIAKDSVTFHSMKQRATKKDRLAEREAKAVVKRKAQRSRTKPLKEQADRILKANGRAPTNLE